MPFDIISQQAQEDMSAHSPVDAMTNRSDPNIEPFEGAKDALDLRQVFIATHRIGRRQAVLGLTGSNHIDAIEVTLTLNRVGTPLIAKALLINGHPKMFAHLVAVQYPADFLPDLTWV